jgi:hypothetical protein
MGMEDAAGCATTPHKSSCASADPSNTETVAAHDDAISDLYGMTCKLKGVLTHYEGTLKCATAWVYPPPPLGRGPLVGQCAIEAGLCEVQCD